MDTVRRGVWLIALKELADPALADDVAQETIVRLLDAMARRGSDIEDPASFARGICRHVIADLRTAARRTESLDSVVNALRHAASEDPLRAAIDDEERMRMRQALDSLAPADRDLLRKLYVDGLSPADVAAASNEPGERVRKRKSRALDRLRQAFFGHDGGRRTTG
jgi:RNA polymerase sigma factor (sigma-70 family)